MTSFAYNRYSEQTDRNDDCSLPGSPHVELKSAHFPPHQCFSAALRYTPAWITFPADSFSRKPKWTGFSSNFPWNQNYQLPLKKKKKKKSGLHHYFQLWTTFPTIHFNVLNSHESIKGQKSLLIHQSDASLQPSGIVGNERLFLLIIRLRAVFSVGSGNFTLGHVTWHWYSALIGRSWYFAANVVGPVRASLLLLQNSFPVQYRLFYLFFS